MLSELFKTRTQPTNYRKVYPEPNTNPDNNKKFPNNAIRTTKYTFLTFLPRNLYEQYRRLSNWYFTFITVLNFIPIVEAINPVLSIVPIALILAFTAIKDAIEDLYRYKCDKKLNNKKCRIYEKSENLFVEKRWKDIKVGDLICLKIGEVVPADFVLMGSSEKDGLCFLQTTDLDGETNLKRKLAFDSVEIDSEKDCLDKIDLNNISFVECLHPNSQLDSFEGRVYPEIRPVDNDNFVLRGCILRNTEITVGIVVYTGRETKTMMNNCGPRLKRSKLESLINHAVLWSFVILMVICTIVGVLNNIQTGLWDNDDRRLFYPQDAVLNNWQSGAVTFARMIILFQVIIPISLYISVELVKLGQIFFIQRDIKLYDKESDKNSQCRAMNITEDLGQVQHIFSDKTGTLTENKMEFKKCSIGCVEFGEVKTKKKGFKTHSKAVSSVQFHHRREKTGGMSIGGEVGRSRTIGVSRASNIASKTGISNTHIIPTLELPPELPTNLVDSTLEKLILSRDQKSNDFFLCLTLCNTVVISPGEGEIFYEGESPDEVALIYAAKSYNFRMINRTNNSITVSTKTTDTDSFISVYEILHIFPFSSERGRMSILVKTESGKIVLFTKGADNVIIPLGKDPEDTTNISVNKYAREGLRTLCMATREIEKIEYENWLVKFKLAESSLEDRSYLKNKCFDILEDKLTILGATGIEDRLQEFVPESIRSFRKAGIKVWVITGDKVETAVNIGCSSELFSNDDELVYLVDGNIDGLTYLPDSNKGFNLVIDGKTFALIFKNASDTTQFLQLCEASKAVLCCRVSPQQKGEIVKLVKDRLKVLTLAIGDGANDVSMLQIADVGIGISGLEGMQAVLNSDFAIPKFHFLRRLILVHGHWSYYRLASMILYFFYRNVVLTFCIFFYQFWSGYYGSQPIDETILLTFSLLFNSLPPLIQGVFDQDILEPTLTRKAELHVQGLNSEVYKKSSFWVFVSLGIYQSVICYFFSQYAYHNSDIDVISFGWLLSTSIILCNLVSQAIEFKTFTWIHWFSLIISFAGFILTSFILCQVNGVVTPSSFGTFGPTFGSSLFWMVQVLIVFVGCFPHLLARVFQVEFFPTSCLTERIDEKDALPQFSSKWRASFEGILNTSFRMN